MKLFLSAVIAFIAATTATGASAAVVPRASNKCYTVHKGYLATYPGEHPTKFVPVGLNSKKQVTYGGGDSWLQVEFQTCPKLPEQAPNLDMYKGRIIVSGVSSNANGTATATNCVTVSNPTAPAKGPFFLEVKKCASDTNPPASQRWEYGNDFGDVVFWTGTSKNDEVGYTDDNESNPVTENGTRRIELGCAVSCSSFSIKTKDQL
ncbi:hypothetical protein FRC04_004252 [Tulasnella sp. 424]|nr:hypothetical protein FRC04_004252 [Tulasnella sp. 424]KAG8979376.1 hypothetical protein FRC05_008361 [Tulasnella sp. 425]